MPHVVGANRVCAAAIDIQRQAGSTLVHLVESFDKSPGPRF